MSHRSPCVPAYRKFCSVWWIVSGLPRNRPRRRWGRGPVIPAFACILAYRGLSSKRTSRHSRAQVPAVFSAVRLLFQRGLDSPRIKNTDRFTTPSFVHRCPSLDAVYYTLVFFLLSLSLSFVERFQFSKERYSKYSYSGNDWKRSGVERIRLIMERTDQFTRPRRTSIDWHCLRRSLFLRLSMLDLSPALPAATASQYRTKSRSMWYP